MSVGNWLNYRRALRLFRTRSDRRRFEYRLRAAICLLLYMHNFSLNSTSTDSVIRSPCPGTEHCVDAQPAAGYLDEGAAE
jgi:hypothetical protein